MVKAYLTIVFTLLLTIAVSSPIKSRKRSFKIPRVRNENYVPNGPRALSLARAKYGMNTSHIGPASLMKRDITLSFTDDIHLLPGGAIAHTLTDISGSATDNENGETSATGTGNDAQFLSPVTVGGQSMIMNFDTGSSDFWVFNTQLPTSQQKGHTIFDPSKSSTFQLLQGQAFKIAYGDGSTAAGPVGTDIVDIGGATVSNQAIGLPLSLSDSFVSGSAANGLVGLAFSKLNTVSPTKQKTFFDNIIPDLTQPVFTAALLDSGGSYEFGKIDTSSFVGELSVASIHTDSGFWQFDSTSATANGHSISMPGVKAIADTGTSLMLVEDSLLQGYWEQVQGATLNGQQGGVIFPCNAELPDLHVAIGDQVAVVQGKYMNFATAGKDDSSGNACEYSVLFHD